MKIPSPSEYSIFLENKIKNAKHNNLYKLVKHYEKLDIEFSCAFAESDMYHAQRIYKLKKRN